MKFSLRFLFCLCLQTRVPTRMAKRRMTPAAIPPTIAPIGLLFPEKNVHKIPLQT